MKYKTTVPAPSLKNQPTATRQEIDASLKKITQLVEKDPKKVVAVLKAWIDAPAKSAKSKRAA